MFRNMVSVEEGLPPFREAVKPVDMNKLVVQNKYIMDSYKFEIMQKNLVEAL